MSQENCLQEGSMTNLVDNKMKNTLFILINALWALQFKISKNDIVEANTGKNVLYCKRIYSANGISRSFFSLHKCFFKTYKNAFKWNASNWD